MLKKCIIIAMLALAGCASFATQELKSYLFKGEEVSLGMSTSDVRAVAGAPTRIDHPSPLGAAMSPMGIEANRGKQSWAYGSLKNGDSEQVAIVFTDGIVTDIRKYTNK